jgi:galactonate dehydratase
VKIASIETLQADAGYRTACYVKLTTDDGLTGWSEYYDGLGGAELAPLIAGFARTAIGMNPCNVGVLSESLLATARLAAGGLAHQAVAAIENACLDVHGKALGVPVYQLFGGPFRRSVPVYWTHCGSFRVRHAAFYASLGYEPVRTLADFTRLGREAVDLGFTALKTNAVFFEPGGPVMMTGGFRIVPGFLDRSITEPQISAIVAQLEAFRAGVGPDFGLMLDVGFSQRTEGFLRLARRLEHLNLFWLELDTPDAGALALVRREARMPIASLESLYGLAQYRPFLAERTADVAIIDPVWNGVWQSVRIATVAEAFETHVAPHNPAGDLATLMSAHFCAAVPNLRIMEYRADEAPWTHEFLSHPPIMQDGAIIVPDRPGWGSDIDEEALRAHPAAA